MHAWLVSMQLLCTIMQPVPSVKRHNRHLCHLSMRGADIPEKLPSRPCILAPRAAVENRPTTPCAHRRQRGILHLCEVGEAQHLGQGALAGGRQRQAGKGGGR